MNWRAFQADSKGWDQHLAALGGDFYQSHGWAEARRRSGWTPVRLLAEDDGQIVAAVSVLAKRKAGIAVCWVPGGPAGALASIDSSFRACLLEQLGTRLAYCRMNILRADRGAEAALLARTGWTPASKRLGSRLTMVLPLAGSEQDGLDRLSGNWRHNLKRSTRHALQLEHWQQPDLDQLEALYREMEALKSLPAQHSRDDLQAMLETLGSSLVLYRCRDAEGRLLAIRAAGMLGERAMDLLAAAGAPARKLYASHATLWALLDHCRRAGVQHYDLSGVDPVNNKGVYDFKQGTGAALVECLGEWEWAALPLMKPALNFYLARGAHE